MLHSVRLSQCMIVKNEEKNIRKALEWGKGTVFEQIVVDTGSDDRTVEIAKEMGAKVFHFPWIDDFSAAKNFAISKAKGSWIVFLDADEYYSAESTTKLIPILEQIENGIYEAKRPHAVRSSLLNLDDKGQVFSTGIQDRIFCNMPTLRYQNRIHESLYISDGSEMLVVDASRELIIYHTGYTKQIYQETGKLERNVRMLRSEVAEHSDDYNAWSYLGDSLFAMESYDEAEEAYLHVIANGDRVLSEGRKEAVFCNYFKLKYLNDSGIEEELCDIYEKAKAIGCTSPDLECWFGYWYYKKEDKKKAVLYFERALQLLDQYHGTSFLDISGALIEIYQILFYIYREFGQVSEMIRYGVLALRMDLYLMPILKDIICLLKTEKGEILTGESTFNFLLKLYNPTSLKNKLFLLKAAELADFSALERRIYGLFSVEEKSILDNSQ
ncbi:glycosyltransferase family 2 protein [Lacrimispora amygdalina]|uniref:Glycosyltransferase family 2 protein n=1 Tax=Lacrimispora amygdalina TaxID=253257 RepID=A0A3E2NHF5_9FIRM|nr:glycosyltransferase family 2 protein [Clostridium indicum]RFZ80340.1 glycosyltransferase family 2 protein [Clostridium indicum]